MDVKARIIYAGWVLLLSVCAGVIAFRVVEAVQTITGWL